MPFWSEKKRSSKSSSSKHSHSKSGSSQHGSSSQRQEIDVPENGFDLTNNDGTIHVLPKQLRRAKCATIYVEFLFTPNSNPDSPDYDHANHVIIKIDFATTVGKYAGVRISMDVDYDYEEYVNDDNVCLKHGCLYVRPVEYLGISYSSSRTLQIGLGRLETPELSALLSPIMENRMQVFSFDCSRDQYQGCKQWVSCVLLLWEHCGFIRDEIEDAHPQGVQLPVGSSDLYGALGFFYLGNPHGQALIEPIIRGAFSTYEAPEDARVPYENSQRAYELQQAFILGVQQI